MYGLEIAEKADKTFSRLAKKYPKQLMIIEKKVKQIRQHPYHFKPLKGDLHGARRVHIDGHFVLIYDIVERRKVVRILDYGHHDKVY